MPHKRLEKRIKFSPSLENTAAATIVGEKRGWSVCTGAGGSVAERKLQSSRAILFNPPEQRACIVALQGQRIEAVTMASGSEIM